MGVLLLILLISKDVKKVPGGVTWSYLGTRVPTNWEFEKAPSGGGRGVRVALFTGRAYRVQGLLTITLVSSTLINQSSHQEVTWLC